MTKIDQVNHVPAQLETPKGKTGKAPGQFKDFLDKALEQSEPGAAQQAPAEVSAGQTIGAEQPLSAASVAAVREAESTLEILDQYSRLLADGRYTLKDLESKVSDLAGRAQGLSQMADGLEPDDRLRSLLLEVAQLASVEAIKFNRGDLIPSA